MPERARGTGQRKIGVVLSRPGSKTAKVRVERLVKHRRYKRVIRRSESFLAHDEQEICREGDWVEIVESRPLSARKRWRVRRIVTRPESVLLREREQAEAEAGGGASS
jgi:small subunit ribosomal protein S17